MSKGIIELLHEYEERFNDNFPTFIFRGTEEEVSKAIEKCLREGKPFEANDDGEY